MLRCNSPQGALTCVQNMNKRLTYLYRGCFLSAAATLNFMQGAYESTTFARRGRWVTTQSRVAVWQKFVFTIPVTKTTTLVGTQQANFPAVFEVCFRLAIVQTKISNFRKMKACVEITYGSRFINEKEFVLLNDAYKSTNPDFSNWNYEGFDLDDNTNDECKPEFHLDRKNIYKLAEQLQLPDETTKNTQKKQQQKKQTDKKSKTIMSRISS